MPADTGLAPKQIQALAEPDAKTLLTWHLTKAGNDDGQPWYPHAIRRMPIKARLELAYDDQKNLLWERRERERVLESPKYFIESYGHVQAEEGPPEPLVFWPRQEKAQENCIGARDQGEVVDAMLTQTRIIVLKARQLGLTWIAVHYGLWLVAFNAKTPRAKVLALSKKGEDATKLLARARRINALLPEYLRHAEDNETKRNLSRFKIQGRGEFLSLPSSPEAARSETATFIIFDEMAHVPQQKAAPTWTALQPTLGVKGKICIIFTGNGPAEAPGDGQAAAALWQRARSGEESNFYPIFLPTSVHPIRDRDAVKSEFLSEEAWAAEMPETEDEALAGQQGMKVYSPAGINAAAELGRHYDLLLSKRQMPPPASEELIVCWDHGEMTHGLLLWPLEGGGSYVVAEVAPEWPQEVEQSTDEMLEHLDWLQDALGGSCPLVGVSFFDAAGAQSNRSYRLRISKLEHIRRFKFRTVAGEPKPITIGVPFAKYKTHTVDYLRHLFNRTAGGRTVSVLAISQRCPVLLRQLRGLEVADEATGRVKKGSDHGPDALIAGLAESGVRFMGKDFEGSVQT